jgi:hypothetical protein
MLFLESGAPWCSYLMGVGAELETMLENESEKKKTTVNNPNVDYYKVNKLYIV